MTLACATCPVATRAACAALTPEERTEFSKQGRRQKLAKGEVLFAAGDERDSCATLVSGALKIASIDREGVESILSLVHPAGFVGELFSPFPGYEVAALVDSEVCLFSRKEVEAAAIRHPALGLALLHRAQDNLHDARELLDLSRRRSARARVAGILLAFARAASDSPCHPAHRYDLPVSRSEMAGLLGLTIETVSRQLSELTAWGTIKKQGARGIELVDSVRLGELAA